MSRYLKRTLTTADVGEMIGIHPDGPKDCPVLGVCGAQEAAPGLIWFSAGLESLPPGLHVVLEGNDSRVITFPTGDPRRTFAALLRHLVKDPGLKPPFQQRISPHAKISPAAFVADHVRIGDGSQVDPGAVLLDGVTIGRNCRVRSGVVIGDSGFGYSVATGSPPEEFPQVGGVWLGDDVTIGTGSTIASGTLSPTVIRNHVKTDNLVHVAHNCVIGERSILAACAEVSGSVVIGKDVWLGPNCSIRDKIQIGDGATVGIGSVVTRDVPPWTVVAGNPARVLRTVQADVGD